MDFIKISNHAKLIYKDRQIDSKEIQENIDFFSRFIKGNSKVCIFSKNRPEWIYTFFATWKKGGINIPIDFMSSVDEVSYILNDSRPDFIFTSEENLKTVEKAIESLSYKPKILIFEHMKDGEFEEKKVDKNVDDTAVILYTSGTTGKPKGVMLSYENLLSNIEGLDDRKIATSDDSTIAILPFHHSYPLMVSMLYPLHIGAKIVFIETLSASEILNVMKKEKISVLIGVPRLYELFHRKIFEKINQNLIAKGLFKIVKKINNQNLSKRIFERVHNEFGGNIKFFVSGGAKLDIDIAKDLWALGFKIIEGYGLTETSPIVSFNPKEKIKLGSVGTPIKDVEVKIEDSEILVKGKNVFKGYLNNPEKTKESFKNGWFLTGDLGYIDEEGYLYITGRKKEIIVLPNGKNINPEEIENKIKKISDIVKEVAVLQKDNHLFLIVYPDFEKIKEKGVVNIEETVKWKVIDKYNLTVPPYERIHGFKIVKRELPKTRLGKIKRFMLDEFLKEEEKEKSVKEPEFIEYRIIKDYLEKVVKRKVYPDNHIEIDLGLDSLEKIEFLTFLENSFGIDISEKELARYPTVVEIAKYVKEKKRKLEVEEVNWKKVLEKEIKVDIFESGIPLILLKYLLKPVFKVYFRLDVKGTENIKEKNAIFISNHQSYLDGFLIISTLPNDVLKDIYFLAEETYFNDRFKKLIGKIFHVIPVNINKNLKETLQKTAYILKNRKSVLIFPEGARTRDGNLLEFKKAFAILSKELNKPVQPIVIKGAFDAFPIGSKFPKPKKITIEYLKPIYPDSKDIDEIVNISREMIEKKLL